MKYQGYIAQIEYSEENNEFFGAIVNISKDYIFNIWVMHASWAKDFSPLRMLVFSRYDVL
jgi:hypothetical protein